MREFPARPAIVEGATAQSKAHHPVLEVLIFFAIFGVCTAIQTPILMVPMLGVIFQPENFERIVSGELTSGAEIMTLFPSWFSLVNLFLTAVVVVGAILYCTKLEKRRLWTMGIVRRGFVAEYGIGWLIGAAMLSAAMIPGLLAGDIAITGLSPDIPWGMLILMLLGFTVQGLSEELLCRSYLCVSLARRIKLQWAIVISSAIFAALHFGNGGVTLIATLNLFLYGVFAALWLIRRGNIWGIAAMHSAWNYVQGNIWGSTVSGLDVGGSLFEMEYISDRTFFAGGSFGLEGGIGVTLVLAVGIAALALMKNRTPHPADPVPAADVDANWQSTNP